MVAAITDIVFVPVTAPAGNNTATLAMLPSVNGIGPLDTGTPSWTVNDNGEVVALTSAPGSVTIGPVGPGTATVTCTVFQDDVVCQGTLLAVVSEVNGKMVASWSAHTLSIVVPTIPSGGPTMDTGPDMDSPATMDA